MLTENGLGWIWSICKKNSSGHPGANPTILSYNASVVNFYNATGSPFKNALAYYNAGVVAVN
jgi:hypothetical protein